MTGLLLLILAVSIITVAFSKVEKSIFYAVAATLIVVALYPSFTIGVLNTAISLVGLVLVLTISTLRAINSTLKAQLNPGVIAFILFVFVSSIANSVDDALNQIFTMLVQGLMLILLTITASYFQSTYRNKLILVFGFVILIQFIVTIGEQFYGTGALWPRVDGTDDIEHRPNYFSDLLIGRSLGTMSMMITLGCFCGFAILLFAQRFLETKHRYKLFWAALISITGLVIFFSGTRSAVVAAMIAVLAWLITSLKSLAAQLLLFIGGSVAMVVILQIDIITLLGFSNFENTESFEHRFGVITSFTTILSEPTGLLFGRGRDGATDLLVNSLGGADGLTAYDNMYVRELAVSGLLGFSLLILFIVRSFLSKDKLSIVLMIYLSVMGMSFDQFTWRVIYVLFALAIAGVFRSTSEKQSNEKNINQDEELSYVKPCNPSDLNTEYVMANNYKNNEFVKKKLFL